MKREVICFFNIMNGTTSSIASGRSSTPPATVDIDKGL